MNIDLKTNRANNRDCGTGIAKVSTMANKSAHGVELVIRTSQANRRELLQTLEEFRNRLATGGGSCPCNIFESMTDANVFLWTEWWPDKAGVEQAKASGLDIQPENVEVNDGLH